MGGVEHLAKDCVCGCLISLTFSCLCSVRDNGYWIPNVPLLISYTIMHTMLQVLSHSKNSHKLCSVTFHSNNSPIVLTSTAEDLTDQPRRYNGQLDSLSLL